MQLEVVIIWFNVHSFPGEPFDATKCNELQTCEGLKSPLEVFTHMLCLFPKITSTQMELATCCSPNCLEVS